MDRDLLRLAERLGKTKRELLTGEPGRLSMRELISWMAHDGLTAREQEKAARR